MGWLDHQDKGSASKSKVEVLLPELEICLDGQHYIPINKHSVDKCYADSMPRLLIVIDEIAELTQKSGLKTADGKAEDAAKDEIISNIQSITQLGRNSGIHCILCTQRNDASVIPGIIQNNPLSLDTLVEVKEK
jgi:DNA segregation ATPase FtsK/SpoIIIE and related proteins